MSIVFTSIGVGVRLFIFGFLWFLGFCEGKNGYFRLGDLLSGVCELGGCLVVGFF